MSWRTKSVTRGLRIGTVAGAALVVLVAFGPWGGAVANHTSCGTYCWSVYPPYPSAGTPYTHSGSGSYQINEQSDNGNGVMTTSQESYAGGAQQEILLLFDRQE